MMEENFLWHRVDEEERKRIKEQARKIMDSFSEKLADIDKKVKEPVIERKEFSRAESKANECAKEFRESMFENAPKKNKDFIIAEKRSW